MRHDIDRWMGDWAAIGGLTSAIAPGMVAMTGLPGMLQRHLFAYTLTCAVVGLLSGALVGRGLFTALGRFPARSRVSLALVFGPPALGAWGALVAGASCAAHYELGLVPFAMAAGSAAAVLQTAWVTPVYTAFALRGWTTLPLVAACALVAPVAGIAAVFAGLLLFGMIRPF